MQKSNVTFDQFNASLLNKSTNLWKKKKDWWHSSSSTSLVIV